jgi:hypothetical protein
MMDTQGLKIDAALICDDIRMEVSGKVILIGVYAGDILLNRIPATIPVAVWLDGRVQGAPGKLKINIYLGDKSEDSVDTVNDLVPLKQGQNGEFFLALNGIPLNVTEPTTVTVSIKQNEDDWIIVTTKRILLAPPNALSSSETPQLS